MCIEDFEFGKLKYDFNKDNNKKRSGDYSILENIAKNFIRDDLKAIIDKEKIKNSIINLDSDSIIVKLFKIENLNVVIEPTNINILDQGIICPPGTKECEINRTVTTSISTTNSVDVSVTAETSAKIFGAGVSFSTTVAYGFSKTSTEETSVSVNYTLEPGKSGILACISIQIKCTYDIYFANMYIGSGRMENLLISSNGKPIAFNTLIMLN